MFEKWKKNKEFERRSEGKTSEFTAIPPEVDAFKNTSAVGKLVKDQIQIKITYGDGTWEIISLSQLERLKNQGILKEVENIKEGSIKKGGQNQQPSYPRPLAVPSGQKKRSNNMSKTLQFVLTGLVGGIVGGVIDVITGKAGAAIVIFGIVIIVGGVVGYFLNRNR